MYGQDILCGISNGTFQIPHKISYPYIERCGFYSQVKIEELLDLRAQKCFWNIPQGHHKSFDRWNSLIWWKIVANWYK